MGGTGVFQTGAPASRLSSAVMALVARAGIGLPVGKIIGCRVLLVAVPSAAVARERSQTTGGLRHSSMIVHMENPGAKTSLPSSSRITRLAPSRVPSSSMWEKRWSAAYRANTSESPGSTPMPTSANRPASAQSEAAANCSSPSLTPTFA